MELNKLKRLVFNSYKVYLIRVKNRLGYCYMNGSGSFVIAIKEGLPDDKHIYDHILKHELGHIYYRHFDNKEKDAEEIKERYTIIKKGQHPDKNQIAEILNKAKDIVINDTVLDPEEIEEVEEYIEGKVCTSERFNAPPFLDYPEYYDYVIKKMEDPSEVSVPNPLDLDLPGMPGTGSGGGKSPEGTEEGESESEGEGEGESEGKGSSKEGEESEDGEGKGSSGEEGEGEGDEESDGPLPSEEEGEITTLEGNDEFEIHEDETDEITEAKGGRVLNPTDTSMNDEHGAWSNSWGVEGGNKGITEEKKASEELKEILKKLIVVNYKLPLRVDSMKKYNRGLIPEGDLLRKSIKQSLEKVKDKPICMMVDSSGSMAHIISIVISTIYECKNRVHPDSVLVTWGDCLDDEVKFVNMTKRIKARLGDNYLLKGCKYIEKKYPNHKKVLISDFMDDDTDKMVKIDDLIRIKIGKDWIYNKYKDKFQYMVKSLF